MKKFIILFFGILLLTGCNKKKEILECSMTSTQNENIVTHSIVVNFFDDNVTKVDIKSETTLAEKYIDYIDTFEKDIDNSFEEYKDKQGITTNLLKKDSSIIFNISISVNDLDDDTKSKLGIKSTYSTYKATKSTLEKDGYSCN